MATIEQLVAGGGAPRAPTEPAAAGEGGAGRRLSIGEAVPWMLPFVAMAFAPYVKPSLVTAYREWMGRMAREAGPAAHAADQGWVGKLMQGPWWHGSSVPDVILKEGFNPAFVGKNLGVKLGEPHGVSLSSRPLTAKGFITGGIEKPIMRVWPNVDPKATLPAWSPEAAGPLHKAYLEALETKVPNIGGTVGQRMALRGAGHTWEDPQYLLESIIRQIRDAEPDTARAFNRALSERLMKQGVQALLMNPNRYDEYELRILDAARAIPMELREARYGGMSQYGQPLKDLLSHIHPKDQGTFEWSYPYRWQNPKIQQLEKFRLKTPRTSAEGPVHLKDYYRQIDPKRILSELTFKKPTVPPAVSTPPPGNAAFNDKLAETFGMIATAPNLVKLGPHGHPIGHVNLNIKEALAKVWADHPGWQADPLSVSPSTVWQYLSHELKAKGMNEFAAAAMKHGTSLASDVPKPLVLQPAPKSAAAASAALPAMPKGIMHDKGWIKIGGKDWVKLTPEHHAVIAKVTSEVYNEMHTAAAKVKPGSLQFWDAVWARLVTSGQKDAAKWLAQHLVK